MIIKEAQNDMRSSYFGGGPGALISGMVWILSGLIAIYVSPQTCILVFFFGGMLIYPLGIVVSKIFRRSGKHKKDNPLATLAIESTFILFVGLFIAYAVFQINQNWFFPIMLMIIGVRYGLFQTLYGMKLYWIFGLVLAISGAVCLITHQPIYISALIGGVIEIIFAIIIMAKEKTS